jgi:hypothetical protein
MRPVYVLNKTNHNRSGIVICGFPFDKGEVTSLNQIITVSQANGLGSDPTFTQKVQWEPYGANHEDGSYRYGKIAFRADVAANSERRAVVNPSGGSYTTVPYDATVYNMFRGIRFYFAMNGQEVELDFNQLTLISTGGSDTHYRRYKYFARPFQTMQWIWVEMTFDVPSLGIYGATQNIISSTPIEHVNFWFRYGCSHISRGGGQSIGQYAFQQRHHVLTDYTALTIAGCDSLFRFEEHIYSKLNLNNFPSNYPTTNGYLYVLEDPNFMRERHTDGMKYATCRNFRGCLILGNNQRSTILAERQEELSAIAEGWGKYVPPAFLDTPFPPNVDPSDRADQTARIDRMMFSRHNYYENLGRRQPMPFPVGPYGLRPFAPGGGNQGVLGNAFHNNPLYYTILASYSREIPYIVHSVGLWGQRPMWLYEQDGTIFKIQNYPDVLLWSGEVQGYSPDYMGMHEFSWPVQAATAQEPAEEWAGLDRQHCSSHQEALAAIISADYFLLDCFAQSWAENFAACMPLYFRNNPTIDSWEADRASARMLQTGIVLYYATGIEDLLKAVIRRYWLGNTVKLSWEYGNPGGIEKLKFIDAPFSWSDGSRNYYLPGRLDQIGDPEIPVGGLFVFQPGANPWMTPWQSAFVVASYVALQRMFEDLFPFGAYMSGYTITKLTGPGQSIAPGSIPLFDSIPRNIAWDLAATVTMHCTHYFGPGSEYNWTRLLVKVVAGNGLFADSPARKIQCFPVGATIRGTVSGTTAIINRLEGGAFPGGGSLVSEVAIALKNVSSPGFNYIGSYISEPLEVIVNGQVIYDSNQYQPNPNEGTATSVIGWYGISSYCFDKYGLGKDAPSYRKPLTKTDLEETDTRCIWNIYTQEGPRWAQFDPYYGVWQAVCASVVLNGIKNNYYTSNDPNYSVAALYSKAKAIVDFKLAEASFDIGEWDRAAWPFLAIYQDFLGNGDMIKAVSTLDGNAVVNEPDIQTNNVRSVTIGKKIGSDEETEVLLQARSIVFPFTVYCVTPTNANISVKAVGDTLYKFAVQDIRLSYDWSHEEPQEVEGESIVNEILIVTTANLRGPKIHAIIQLSIDGPKLSTSPDNVPVYQEYPDIPISEPGSTEPGSTIDNEDVGKPLTYPYTVNPITIA